MVYADPPVWYFGVNPCRAKSLVFVTLPKSLVGTVKWLTNGLVVEADGAVPEVVIVRLSGPASVMLPELFWQVSNNVPEIAVNGVRDGLKLPL